MRLTLIAQHRRGRECWDRSFRHLAQIHRRSRLDRQRTAQVGEIDDDLAAILQLGDDAGGLKLPELR